jgi:hypothetical protein
MSVNARLMNIAILVLLPIVGYRVVAPLFTPHAPSPYRPGDRCVVLTPAEFSRSPLTLLLVIRSTCVHCASSLPFYQQIVARVHERQTQARIVAVSLEPREVCASFLKANAVSVDAVVEPAMPDPRLTGTPTLLLVTSRGVVAKVWVGVVSEDQQKEILAALGAT